MTHHAARNRRARQPAAASDKGWRRTSHIVLGDPGWTSLARAKIL